ncbi:MAG TPA: antitoxin Xre/MbcA/ParS toxin-binding domain-containing protein [Saliniramus sp.]|nr:antitoxin Xre/MbcA/ParS toxin-binding domain-containing protein [Saliniramus sp.]HMB08972.1 antitoxin Xre/MbcA/ParS toxin-binding domain-containing protein [Saliniramus sp.]
MSIAVPAAEQSGALAGDSIPIRAFAMLGGRRVVAHGVQNSIDAHDVIMRGLPSASLMHLIARVRVLSHGDALEKAIGMSSRTLQRRRKDAADTRLSVEQSSRAWRFAEILARAIDVMGSQEAAEAWLEAQAIGLDNRRPIDLLPSAAGAEAVENYLTRLEYGVYT